MKKGVERGLIVFLFTLVLVMFSLAQRDSRKLDRIYQTAAAIQQKNPAQVVQALPSIDKSPVLR
jgi:hypothetical protein